MMVELAYIAGAFTAILMAGLAWNSRRPIFNAIKAARPWWAIAKIGVTLVVLYLCVGSIVEEYKLGGLAVGAIVTVATPSILFGALVLFVRSRAWWGEDSWPRLLHSLVDILCVPLVVSLGAIRGSIIIDWLRIDWFPHSGLAFAVLATFVAQVGCLLWIRSSRSRNRALMLGDENIGKPKRPVNGSKSVEL